MGIFKKFFGGKKKVTDNEELKKYTEISENQEQIINDTEISKPMYNGSLGFSIELSAERDQLKISSLPVGVSTGSTAKDFYVYEWFIKDTGEIFYVGKGRGNRYKEFHQRAYEAEKIRKMFETDTHFVATGLSEDEAIELESKEMIRILNETNYRLTNRIIPSFTKRDNGYNRSSSTPEIQFETAPMLFACEIEEHYFNVKHRAFDKVEYRNLKAVAFISSNMRDEIGIIYGGNVERYKDEVTNCLVAKGNKILKSKYAKSITAWIYIGDDYVSNYMNNQKKAKTELGREIPTYHLIDVWKFLKNQFGEIAVVSNEEPKMKPLNNRVPLNEIRNLRNWEKGFEQGYPYYEEGDRERKAGNIERAIDLLDKARYQGYNAPALYFSYAMAYRKIKDYENEIAIIDEAIERLKADTHNNETRIMEFNERRSKALGLLKKAK